MDSERRTPEWIPENADKSVFTTSVMSGVSLRKDATADETVSTRPRPKRRVLSDDELRAGVLAGDRTVLAQAITLVESNNPEHFERAQKLLTSVLPATGNSFRIGITGVPGAGKSSFIETFGTMLCDKKNKRVAVLAVDPSSSRTGGSVLGDKTRMENLSRRANAFIRPSPSGCVLGGVARKTRETMLLCEAAGFDVILIETVGVGQSEVAVRSMSDFFLLLQLAVQGDDLQGIKKGVIELADGILVNKCDGNLVEKSNLKRAELEGVLHFLSSATPDWQPFCRTCSALTGDGVEEAWDLLEKYRQTLTANGYWHKRRAQQNVEWFKSLIEREVVRRFFATEGVENAVAHYMKLVETESISPAKAVSDILGAYLK